MKLTKKVIRDYLSLHRNNRTPIHIIPKSELPPQLIGESYYFTTPSGKTIVRYPMAYQWKTVYHPSTQVIVVGEWWENED